MDDKVGSLERLLAELRRLNKEIPRLRDRAVSAGKALWDHVEGGGRREEAPDMNDEILNAAPQLLVAVARIRRAAGALNSLTGYHLLRQEIDAFDERVQDAGTFRDFFEHAEDYLRGTGKLSDRVLWPGQAEMAIFPDGDLIFGVRGDSGTLIAGLTLAADAGERLSQRVLVMGPALRQVLPRQEA
jgi:hypothetical protein